MTREFACRLQIYKTTDPNESLVFQRQFWSHLQAHIDTREMRIAQEISPGGVLMVCVDVPFFYGEREKLLISLERLQRCQLDLVKLHPWCQTGMVDQNFPVIKRLRRIIGRGGTRPSSKTVKAI